MKFQPNDKVKLSPAGKALFRPQSDSSDEWLVDEIEVMVNYGGYTRTRYVLSQNSKKISFYDDFDQYLESADQPKIPAQPDNPFDISRNELNQINTYLDNLYYHKRPPSRYEGYEEDGYQQYPFKSAPPKPKKSHNHPLTSVFV